MILPKLPPTRKVESYPLGDYLYDRAQARYQLQNTLFGWEQYKLHLPESDRDTVEKIERLMADLKRKKVEKIA